MIMIKPADLPDVLPIFPLPGALLLPRARLPLHIFEPRYLAMLDDALKTSTRLIGMIQPLPNLKNPDGLHLIGCAGRVSSFSETEDGRYMITLAGISRFRLDREEEGFTPYRRARVTWDGFSSDLGPTEKDPQLDRAALNTLLERYFAASELKTDWDTIEGADDELLINSLSMLCPFDAEEKQALLEAPSLTNRRETLVTLMEMALRRGTDFETMQ